MGFGYNTSKDSKIPRYSELSSHTRYPTLAWKIFNLYKFLFVPKVSFLVLRLIIHLSPLLSFYSLDSLTKIQIIYIYIHTLNMLNTEHAFIVVYLCLHFGDLFCSILQSHF